jgi:hypothetical protein
MTAVGEWVVDGESVDFERMYRLVAGVGEFFVEGQFVRLYTPPSFVGLQENRTKMRAVPQTTALRSTVSGGIRLVDGRKIIAKGRYGERRVYAKPSPWKDD